VAGRGSTRDHAESFYYAASVSYSVGFGAFSENSTVPLRFSVFIILCGASFVGGALGNFVTAALELRRAAAAAVVATVAVTVAATAAVEAAGTRRGGTCFLAQKDWSRAD